MNKMDRMGADFDRCVDMIRNRLKCKPVPIQLPIGAEDGFVGLVDLITMKAIVYKEDTLGAKFDYEEIPDDLKEKAEGARAFMLDSVAENDETLLEKHLGGEGLTVEEIKSGLRKGCLEMSLIPIICGASFKNKGVQPMLDAVIELLPSPLDVPPIQGVDPDDKEKILTRPPSDTEPFSALAFKIISDPHGTLSFIRVYSGVLDAGANVLNPRTGKKSRIGRLVKMHANKREEVEFVEAGDIAAAIGLKEVFTGDTLCDEDKPVLLEVYRIP